MKDFVEATDITPGRIAFESIRFKEEIVNPMIEHWKNIS